MAPDPSVNTSGFARAVRASGAVLLLSAGAVAQTTETGVTNVPAAGTKFAPPIRMKVGDQYLGEKRSYPSPVLQDMNGDGRPDLVIGDLRGKITVALRQPGDGLPQFAADKALKGRDGKDLNFANW